MISIGAGGATGAVAQPASSKAADSSDRERDSRFFMSGIGEQGINIRQNQDKKTAGVATSRFTTTSNYEQTMLRTRNGQSLESPIAIRP